MSYGCAGGGRKWLAFGLFAGVGLAILLMSIKRQDRVGDNEVTEAEVDDALDMTFPASDPPAY
jgi:hypothetical protein